MINPDRLEIAMENCGFNNKQLAYKSGVHETVIGRLVRNPSRKITLETAKSIAKALDVSLDWLTEYQSKHTFDEPVLMLEAKGGVIKCRYPVAREIDGVVYIINRDDEAALTLFVNEDSGADPERWKEDAEKSISAIEGDLQNIGHLETSSADELRDETERQQDLEYKYPDGFLENAPWKSGEIRLSYGSHERTMTVEEFKEEFKRRHRS